MQLLSRLLVPNERVTTQASLRSLRDESVTHASCRSGGNRRWREARNRSTQICIKGLESDLHAEAEVHFVGWFPAPDAPVLHGRLV